MSIPSRYPKDRTLQTHLRRRNAHPLDTDPTVDDENSRGGFPEPHRPMDTFARRLPECHKQRGATALLSAIVSQPTVRKPTLLHNSHKRARIPAAAWFQTSRDIPSAYRGWKKANPNEPSRKTDGPAAAEPSRPNLPLSNNQSLHNRPPGQIPNTVHWSPGKHRSKNSAQKSSASRTHC